MSRDSGYCRSALKLGTLGCYRYKLINPYEVTIEKVKDGVIAYIDIPVADYGFGETASDAIDYLKENLIEHYYTLRRYKDRLGPGPTTELAELESNIEIKWFDI